MRRLWRDLKWWWHARKRGVLDRTRFGAAEVVVPRWWDLRRWADWLRAVARQELVLPAKDGRLYFHRLRVLPAAPARVTPIVLKGGKTIVPQPVPKAALNRLPDPSRRAVPDEVLEESGVLIPED